MALKIRVHEASHGADAEELAVIKDFVEVASDAWLKRINRLSYVSGGSVVEHTPYDYSPRDGHTYDFEASLDVDFGSDDYYDALEKYGSRLDRALISVLDKAVSSYNVGLHDKGLNLTYSLPDGPRMAEEWLEIVRFNVYPLK